MFVGGYVNQVNADYSEVVIGKQREIWPEMDWRVLDCLDMKEIGNGSFGERQFVKNWVANILRYASGK